MTTTASPTHTAIYTGSHHHLWGWHVIGTYPCNCYACVASLGDLDSPVRMSATLMRPDGRFYQEIEHARPGSVGITD
jgi:hypothetical protein